MIYHRLQTCVQPYNLVPDSRVAAMQAKADFDREAAVVKEWEIEHGVVLPKPIPKSRLAAGVKPKAKGQPKTLNSATAPATDAAAAAEKPKGASPAAWPPLHRRMHANAATLLEVAAIRRALCALIQSSPWLHDKAHLSVVLCF